MTDRFRSKVTIHYRKMSRQDLDQGNADPDPNFYLIADPGPNAFCPDQDPGPKADSDPEPVQDAGF